MTKTVLFLDIDGVFSIPDPADHNARLTRLPIGDGHHIVCWPIPMYRQLVYTIGITKGLSPVWLSAWGDAGHILTNHAMTQAFPVAYPLSERRMKYARQRFSGETAHIDRKLLAAVYYLATRKYDRVIWLEDGFAPETLDWARCTPHVRLIDTTRDEVRTALLAGRDERDAQAFVARYLSAG